MAGDLRVERDEGSLRAEVPAGGAASDAGLVSEPMWRGGRALSAADVLRLQRATGNRTTSAILLRRQRVLQRLGTPLDKPLPSGAPKPAHGETKGEQRRYTPAQYEEMWEAEQGRQLSTEELETIARGCIGITANNLSGGGNPPLDEMYGTFDQAHNVALARNLALDFAAVMPGGFRIPGRFIVFGKLFWSNQDPDETKRRKGDPTKFLPNPKTGRVDMTGYNYERQPGRVNFDYGFWDETSQSFWHANHAEQGDPDDPMIVLQSTKEKFAKPLTVNGERRYGYRDFDRVAYGVAFAVNYNPGRAAMAVNTP